MGFLSRAWGNRYPLARGQAMKLLHSDVAPVDVLDAHKEYKDDVEDPRDIEHAKRVHVALANALAHPRTVVVHVFNAHAAVVAVLRVRVLVNFANVAEASARAESSIGMGPLM
jgi:hypothetical protein